MKYYVKTPLNSNKASENDALSGMSLLQHFSRLNIHISSSLIKDIIMKKSLLYRSMVLILLIATGQAKATSTVSANFTGTPIAAGNKIWFTAAVKITGTATYPLTIYFSDQHISSPAFSHTVPNAILILDPAVSVATTVFNGTTWVTTAKPNEPGYYFLSGFRDSLTAPLPGSLSPVTWSGTFTASRPGISILWHMAAAVYTTMSNNLNHLGVKPSDCSSCSYYLNAHSSGAPENYLSYVIGGARGGGGSNYTGGFSGAGSVSPCVVNSNTHLCVGNTVTITPGSTCSSWSSSNASVATVSSGVVSGVTAGTARISYLLTGCSIWQTVTVTVNAAPTITATASPATMCVGATLTLNAMTSSSSGGGCSSSAAIAWHGPGGFSSSLLHPTRIGMTPEMAGVYSVSVTDGGCTATATTPVIVVNKLPTTITATVSPIPICAGNTINLNGTVTGGSGYTLLWTGGTSVINNSTTTNANITSAAISDAGTYSLTATTPGCSGIVRGTATLPIVHKLPTSFTATVNPSPACQGSSVTLRATSSGSAGTINYSWAGPAGGASIINPTSITTAGITAIGANNAGIYTVTASAEGCGTTAAYTSPLVINKLPVVTAVVNPGNVCVGGTFSLIGTATGGNGYTLLWTGGTSTINNKTTTNATVTSATLTDAGSYTLTATAPACGSIAANTNLSPLVVNVGPTSSGATNNGPVCAGGTATLSANSSNATTWSWTGPVGFTSSLQNPTLVVTATATYSLILGNPASGCTSSTVYTTTVTVGSSPSSAAPTNNGPVCTGGTVTLNANSTGATAWSWTGPGGFTSTLQNPTTTVVAGTYSLTVSNPGSGCGSSAVYTTVVAVNAAPSAAPTNSGPICAGNTITLNANSTGATAWSWTGPGGFTSTLQNPVITPTASGIYSLTVSNPGTGCTASSTYTTSVVVNPLPTIDAGTDATICSGNTTTLNATGGSSYSWAPNTGLSSAIGATVTASPGATTTYTVTGSTSAGCSSTATVTVSVNATPTIDAGSGAAICNGSSATLTATGATTYSWAPVTGLLPATGASTIANPATSTTYTVTGTTGGCSSTATVTVIVNPMPDAGSITGPGVVCVNSTIALSGGAGTGIWSSSASGIATVSSMGVVMGIALGTATISYIVTNSCGTAVATKDVTVNNPSVSLSGPSDVTVGSNILLYLTEGNWSSSDISVATVDATGTVTGINGGTATISYTVSNSCFSFTTTKAIAVNTIAISPITGALVLCVGNTTALSDATAGGTWSSSNTTVATVSSTGVVTGVSAGTAIISYSLSSSVVTAVITINELPAAITGTLSVCAGMTTTLMDITDGGTWSINPTSIATIGSSTGIVTAGSVAGTATATYTLATGCFVTAVVSVNGLPAAIGGTKVVCVGATTTLTETSTGGTWSSSNAATASVGATTGIVTGNIAGVAMITYTLSTGCIGTTNVTVNAIPAITGTLTVCQGATTALNSSTGGGTWSSSNVAIATVGAGTGVVTGVAGGTARITYTTGSNCSSNVVVIVSPILPIAGNNTICVGTTATLTDGTTGGTWSSSDATTASVISSSGVVTGVSVGTATISYSLSNGCFRTTTVNVITLTPITGTMQVCVGLTTTLSNATPGGTWSSTSVAIATINSSGVATGVAVGTNYITYTAGSCRVTALLTVVAAPAVISGPTSVCIGASATLTDATAGGTWSTTSSSVTISGTATTSLTVTGVTAGVATITYTAGVDGCYRLQNVTVNALPAPIAGTFTVCPGGAVTLTDATTGGTWTSSNTSIATVIMTTGLVNGVTTGTTLITYKVNTGCMATAAVTVITSPSAIIGPSSVCTGSTITLSDSSGSGTWSSSNVGFATVGSSSGIVTGVAASTPFITFTLSSTGCKVRTPITVIAIPNAGTLSGPTVVAVGSNITLTSNGTSGGDWSSSNTNASVGTTGIVTGVSAGSTTITYAVSNVCGYSGAYKPITIAAGRAANGGSGNNGTTLANLNGIMPGINQENNSGNAVKATKSVSPLKNNVSKGRPITNTTVAQAKPVLSDVRVLPNPNKGAFTIKATIANANNEEVSIEVRSVLGQLVYKNKLIVQNGNIDEQVQLNSYLPNGTYMLSIKTTTEQKVVHFVMEH